MGCARLHPADSAADHPRAGLGPTPVRVRNALRRPRRYACSPRHFVCRDAQRPGPGRVALGTPDPGAPGRHRIATTAEGRRVRPAGRPGPGVGIRHRQRIASPISRRRDLPRDRHGRRSRRSLPGRHRRTAPRRRRPRGLAATRRTSAAVWPATARPGAADRRRRRCGPAGTGRHGHRHTAGPRDRLRPGRRPLVGDPRRRRHPAHLQPGAGLSKPGRRHRLRLVDRRPADGIEFVVGLDGFARRRHRRVAGCGDRCRFGDRLGIQQSAVGRRSMASGRLRPPGDQQHHHHHPQRDHRRCAGPTCRGRNRHRDNDVAVRRGRQTDQRGVAVRRDAVGPHHRDRHRRRVARGAVRDHRLVDHAVRRPRLRASDQYSAHRARPRSPTERRCGAMGSGFRSAGQAGLRDGSDERAMRAVDGAGDGNTRDLQSHAERPAADVGAADDLGPRPVGTQAGRSGRRAGHRPGSRRLRSGRRPRRGLCRHRRRSGHRVDGTAASGAAQDAPDAHPHPAPTHRSDRSAGRAQHVAGARAPDHGGRRLGRRSAGPGAENIGATGPAADSPG